MSTAVSLLDPTTLKLMKINLNYLFLHLWCNFLKNQDPGLFDVVNERLEGFTIHESVFYKFVDSSSLIKILKETVETSKFVKKMQMREIIS